MKEFLNSRRLCAAGFTHRYNSSLHFGNIANNLFKNNLKITLQMNAEQINELVKTCYEASKKQAGTQT
jgi:hypothetical protein